MNNKTLWLLLSVLSLAAFLTACDKVPINPNDSSPPTVEFKIKNESGQYEKAGNKPLNGFDTMTFSCVAVDPQGIKSVALTFEPHHATNCLIEKTFFKDGAPFPITGVPSDLGQSIVGDSENKVLTKLLLFSDFGPVRCSVPGKGEGFPIDNYIKVTCSGENWSNNPAASKADDFIFVGVNAIIKE